MAIDYDKFLKKPFGLFALTILSSSVVAFIYFNIKIYYWEQEGGLERCLAYIANFFVFLAIHSLAIATNYDDIECNRRCKTEEISVVMEVYERLVYMFFKLIYLICSSFIEITFRKYYIKLFNFINLMTVLENKADSIHKELKKANDTMIKKENIYENKRY